MTMVSLASIITTDEMREMVINEKKTHEEVSLILKRKNPGVKGLSKMSIRRYCAENGICKRTKLNRDEIKKEVSKFVSKAGKNYGRKMMTGCLRSQGILISETKVGQALREICPAAQKHRQVTAGRSLNPKVYSSEYFGHKLHIDQNEKLVMYGVTHVAARDGYSGMIVGFTTMPIKNNLLVYENLFKPILEQYGVWDQIRVDGGLEFVLVCFVQDILREARTNTSRQPWVKTKSTDNNIIERIWVEVNSRVNYPIKKIMNELVQTEVLDLTDEVTKFCVSWVLCRVSNYGLSLFVQSWNHHSIPKKGKPIDLARTKNSASALEQCQIPSTHAAVEQHKSQGGKLKHFSTFGIDPLHRFTERKAIREKKFLEKYGENAENIFEDILAGGKLLQEAILFFKSLSR